jgi:hypothetical protein
VKLASDLSKTSCIPTTSVTKCEQYLNETLCRSNDLISGHSGVWIDKGGSSGYDCVKESTDSSCGDYLRKSDCNVDSSGKKCVWIGDKDVKTNEDFCTSADTATCDLALKKEACEKVDGLECKWDDNGVSGSQCRNKRCDDITEISSCENSVINGITCTVKNGNNCVDRTTITSCEELSESVCNSATQGSYPNLKYTCAWDDITHCTAGKSVCSVLTPAHCSVREDCAVNKDGTCGVKANESVDGGDGNKNEAFNSKLPVVFFFLILGGMISMIVMMMLMMIVIYSYGD